MNSNRRDVFSSALTIPSRRDVLRALCGIGLGSLRLADVTLARKKRRKTHKKSKPVSPTGPTVTCTPKCGRKQCGQDGCGGSCGECAADQVCATGTCCTPAGPEVTCKTECGYPEGCPQRCGIVPDRNCHRPVADCGTCPSGQQCLSNGACAIDCAIDNDCPFGQQCLCRASAEGPKHCGSYHDCRVYTQVCTTLADCRPGWYCQVTTCGPGGSNENRCVPLCAA
jgi:hypothetical protein